MLCFGTAWFFSNDVSKNRGWPTHIETSIQTILIPAKYNHKCLKEINLTPSRRFSNVSKFQISFVKNEKIHKFGLNYHKCMVQTLLLRILRGYFFFLSVGYFSFYGRSITTTHRNIIHYLTVAVMNRCFISQWLA